MRRVLKGMVIGSTLVVVVYVGMCAYYAGVLTEAVRSPLVRTPAVYGLPYEAVEFRSAVDGIALKGWLIAPGNPKTILMLHAKDGKRDDPDVGLLELSREFVQRGYAVFAFDFRGHGESGGTQFGLATLEVRDVSGALSMLQARGAQVVGTIGFSMGAATALNSAPDHPEMGAIVADSSFADLQQLLDVEIPKQSGLPSIFTPGLMGATHVLYDMDLANDKPVRAVARLGSRPVLLIHGTADAYVPLSDAYALQQAGSNDPNLSLWVVPGAEHVRAYKLLPVEFVQRVMGFFARYAGGAL